SDTHVEINPIYKQIFYMLLRQIPISPSFYRINQFPVRLADLRVRNFSTDQADGHNGQGSGAHTAQKHKTKVTTDFILILFAAGNHLSLIFAVSVSRHFDRNLSDSFDCKVSVVGAVPVVGLLFLSLVGFSSQKMRQLCIHHFAEVFSNHLPDIKPDHLEYLLRLGLNLFENGNNLGYTDLNF